MSNFPQTAFAFVLSFNFNSFDSATLIHSCPFSLSVSPSLFLLSACPPLDVSTVTFSSQFPPASLKEQTQLIMQSIYNMLKQPVLPLGSHSPHPIWPPLLPHCRVHCSATCWFTSSPSPSQPSHSHTHSSFLSAAH